MPTNCALAGVGTFLNRGWNIDSGATCGFSTIDGSLSNTDPRLGPLANNGGHTLTMALEPGSPAVDAVNFISLVPCPPTDQRGVNRPQDGDGDGVPRCDIGAFERGGAFALEKILPNIGGNTGVMLLQNGNIRGGDAFFDYIGAYSSANGRWKGEIVNREHTLSRGERPLFGSFVYVALFMKNELVTLNDSSRNCRL